MDDHYLDTMLRDAHRVAPPDPATIEQARSALAMAITTEKQPIERPKTARRRHRRLGIVIGGVAGTLGAVGAAAGGLFDANTEQMVNDADCAITSADARLVASETNPEGKVIEYWTINRTNSFGDLLVEKLPDGAYDGSSLGCSAEPRNQIPFYADRAWASGALVYTPGVSSELSLYGQIPPGSSAATVELTDGTTVTVTPDDEQGYFLHLLVLSPTEQVGVVSLTPLP